jgi:hypothetical protein
MKAAAGELQDADLDVISGGRCCGQTCENDSATCNIPAGKIQ